MGLFSRRRTSRPRRFRAQLGAEDLEGRALLSSNFFQEIGSNITAEWHKIVGANKKHEHLFGISINLQPHHDKAHGL